MTPPSNTVAAKRAGSGHEDLRLFTRYPEPGRTKTRLIPALGSEGAAKAQREMTAHTVERLGAVILRRRLHFAVHFEGGSVSLMRRWLGPRASFFRQGDGDLGHRLHRAATAAFAAGARAVVMIGADCPGLDSATVEAAFDQLHHHSLVFGPATDGGYYLIGLKRPMPELFDGIPWGTDRVLAESIAIARTRDIDPYLLPELSDVDEPEDLVIWEKARESSRTLSVIVPTLNEEGHLDDTLAKVCAGRPCEIIVTDGGSTDKTVAIAKGRGATVITSRPNRARQLNAGATLATGATLLFLHADTELPDHHAEAIQAALERPDVVGGAFGFQIREPFRGRAVVEWTANLRSRWGRMPYGDQALFVRRWAFDYLGGFPELPFMEDYEFVRRLRRIGRIVTLDQNVRTSGRRWLRLGFVRTTVINKMVILGYRMGIAPARLAAFYRRAQRGSANEES